MTPFFDAISAGVSGTPGTGTITIGSVASSGSRDFSNVPPNSIVQYRIDEGTAWEIGYGLWNGTTLTRTMQYSSTGSLLSVSSAGVVSLTIPADRISSHPGRGLASQVYANIGSTTWTREAWPNNTTEVSGTVSNPGVQAFGNLLSRQVRLRYTPQSNGTGQDAGFFAPSNGTGNGPVCTISTTAFCGGFEFVSRFGFPFYADFNCNLEVGLLSNLTGAPGTGSTYRTSRSTSAMFGKDNNDSTIQFHCRNAGTGTQINTGIAMVVGGWYEAAIWAYPGVRELYWMLTRLDTGVSSYGKVTNTSHVPPNDTALSPLVVISNGGATNSHVIDIQSIYLRSSSF